ncbi:MAG: DUF302 domain-containing protein [bacterium]
MNNNNFDYTVQSKRDFDSTAEGIINEIEKYGMRVLHIHDVRATLAQKGLASDSFKMIEFCKADYADTLLRIDPRIGVFLPCKISVYVREHTTHVSVLNFDHVVGLFSDKSTKDIFVDINTILRKIVSKQ